MITGNSLHNQRIKRFWQDLHYAVTNLFYWHFYHMEHINLLDPANEQRLYALHYVYIPRVNTALSKFRAGWNNHRLRTEHHLSQEHCLLQECFAYNNPDLLPWIFSKVWGKSMGSPRMAYLQVQKTTVVWKYRK